MYIGIMISLVIIILLLNADEKATDKYLEYRKNHPDE